MNFKPLKVQFDKSVIQKFTNTENVDNVQDLVKSNNMQKFYHKIIDQLIVAEGIDINRLDDRYRDAVDIDLIKSLKFTQVGLGGIGSPTLQALIGMGATKYSVYDFDTVETHNCGPQMHRIIDIGKNKVDAAAEQMLCFRNINLKTYNKKIDNLTDFEEALGHMDILIGAVDNMIFRNKMAGFLGINNALFGAKNKRLKIHINNFLFVSLSSFELNMYNMLSTLQEYINTICTNIQKDPMNYDNHELHLNENDIKNYVDNDGCINIGFLLTFIRNNVRQRLYNQTEKNVIDLYDITLLLSALFNIFYAPGEKSFNIDESDIAITLDIIQSDYITAINALHEYATETDTSISETIQKTAFIENLNTGYIAHQNNNYGQTAASKVPKVYIDTRMSLGSWTVYTLPLQSMIKTVEFTVGLLTQYHKFFTVYKTFDVKEEIPFLNDCLDYIKVLQNIVYMMTNYTLEGLFNPDDGEQEPCTARAIVYTGFNIASYIGAIVNYLTSKWDDLLVSHNKELYNFTSNTRRTTKHPFRWYYTFNSKLFLGSM